MTFGVSVEKKGVLTTVILERPEVRNAVDGPMAGELARAFREFEDDEEALVAVLWGRGSSFCAGADIKALGDENRRNPLSLEGDGPMGPTRLELSKPVIAAVSGYVVAGGLELVLWCDLRVVDESAVFGVFCRRWGVPLIDGGTVRLPRLIGSSRAMDLILTGRPVDATEALEMGLANRVVPEGEVLQEAEKLAMEISRFPEKCMRQDRLSLKQQEGMNLKEAMVKEFGQGLQVLEEEAFSGAKRFAEGEGRHGTF